MESKPPRHAGRQTWHISRSTHAPAVIKIILFIALIDRPLRRRPIIGCHVVVFARRNEFSSFLGSLRSGLSAARDGNKSTFNIGDFFHALTDAVDISGRLWAKSPVQMRQTRRVPVGANRLDNIVQQPTLFIPPPHLRCVARRTHFSPLADR